jgi:hypothetical protein
VTPWAGAATPSGPAAAPAATPLTTLLLGGLLIAGVVSLGTGYVLQRRALAGERQRRRWLTTSMRQAPARNQQRWRVAPVTVRRLRVSHHTRRRVRVHVARHRGAPTRLVAQLAHPQPAPPAELVEALDNLRRELLNLQRLLPSARRAATPAAGSIAATRASGRSS